MIEITRYCRVCHDVGTRHIGHGWYCDECYTIFAADPEGLSREQLAVGDENGGAADARIARIRESIRRRSKASNAPPPQSERFGKCEVPIFAKRRNGHTMSGE